MENDHQYSLETLNYICGYCKKRFKHKIGLKEHEHRHSGYKRHSCSVCNKMFFTKIELKCHMVVSHGCMSPYFCSMCKRFWITEDMYTQHMITHFGEKRLYSCKDCNRKYKTIGKFKVHQSLHFERKLQGSCRVCSKTFTNLRILLAHRCDRSLTLKELGANNGFCPLPNVKDYFVDQEEQICNGKSQFNEKIKSHLIYKSRKKLNNSKRSKSHQLNVQTKSISFNRHKAQKRKLNSKCYKCGKPFPSRLTLTEHVDKCNVKNSNFSCRNCGKSYSYWRGLEGHSKRGRCNSKPPPCHKCGDTFRLFRQYTMHVKYSKTCGYQDMDMTRKIECDKCTRKFVHVKSLQSHQKSCNALVKKKTVFECPVCNRVLKSECNLKIHMISHTKEKNYCCARCGEKFLYKDYLNMHYRQNDECGKGIDFPRLPYQPEKWMCEFCGKVGFRNRQEFNLHSLSHTEDVVCKKCGSKFSNFSMLRRHEQQSCMGDKVCSVCGKKGFRNKPEFSKHMYEHNPGFKLNMLNLDYKCGKCGSGFARQNNLNNHLKHFCSHGIICEHCGKGDFKSKPDFRKHMNDFNHTYNEPNLQDLICHLCFRSFNTQTAKDKHIVSVHKGSKNPETGNFDYFPCDRCNEVMTTIELLRSHQKALHDTSVAKLQCKVCAKFYGRKHLATHMRTHTGETPYKCEKCSKQFKSATNLAYHRNKQNCDGSRWGK